MEAKRTKHDCGLSLPEDIVFDVLARLPAKALCRLRCVCKGWRALISDHAFVAAHRSRAADPHLVAVFSGSRYLPEVRVMDMDGNVVKAFEIARSTPLLPTRPDLICDNGWNGGMIIDPAAGEAFGTSYPVPLSISYSHFLGRAAPSGVFKVLRLQEPFLMNDGNGGRHQLCEVATVMDGNGGGAAKRLTWRRKSAPPFVITDLNREYKAIVNGVIYLIHKVEIDVDVNEDEDEDDVSSNLIVAFDLEREEWKAEAISGPTLKYQEGESTWSFALAELNGTLAFVHKVFVNRHPCTIIWLLTDPDKSVWVKEYVIPMPKNHRAPAKPLGALVDGRILLWSSVLEKEETRDRRCGEVVLLYDPSTKAFTNFMEMAKGFQHTLVLYTGSLLSCRESNVGKHL